GANREPDNSHLADKTCTWCGQRAGFAYSVPQDWENILPKLRPGIGRVFFACSDLHAEMIASKIFKDAFDYVTLSPPTCLKPGGPSCSVASDFLAVFFGLFSFPRRLRKYF